MILGRNAVEILPLKPQINVEHADGTLGEQPSLSYLRASRSYTAWGFQAKGLSVGQKREESGVSTSSIRMILPSDSR